MAKNGGEAWPRWPAGTPGTVVLDVVVDKKPEELFLMAYGGDSEFRRKVNEAVGNKDFVCSPWLASEEETVSQQGSDAAAPLPDPAALKPGAAKKQAYSSSSMGVKFRNEELVRLVEAAPGSAYLLEVCVCTNATYGDKFRPVLRHELRAVDASHTALRVVATLVFVKSVNGLLKGMMEKGARDGMKSNFSTFRKTLEAFAAVTEAGAVAPAAVAAVVPLPAVPEVAVAAEGAGPLGVPQPSVLESVAGVPLVHGLQPWAAYLHSLTSQYPVVSGLSEGGMLVGLAVLCLLCALRVVVDVLRFVQHASQDPQDTVALITHYVFKAVDVPDNIQEVLSACVLLYLVRVLVNRLASRLPRPPAAAASGAGAPAPAIVGAAEAVTAAKTAPAQGAAVLVGAPSSPVKSRDAGLAAAAPAASAAASLAASPPVVTGAQSLSPRSDAEEQQGVQYEGYAQVMADLDKQFREDENNLTSPPLEPSSSWTAGSMQRFNEQGSKAMKMLKGNFHELKKSMKALTVASAKSAPNLKEISGSPEKQQGGPVVARAASAGVELARSEPAVSEESSDEEGQAAPGALSASPVVSGPAAVNGAHVGTESTAASQTPAALLDASTPAALKVVASAAPDARPAAAKDATGPQEPLKAAEAKAAAPVSDTAIGGEGAEGAAASGTPDVARRSSSLMGDAVAGSGGSFFSRALWRPSVSGDKTPTSVRKKSSGDGAPLTEEPLSPRQSTRNEWEVALSSGRLQRVPAALISPDVPPELHPYVVTAEVFENQRLQPFRGWGHTWPGHFLPHDKVHHWSLRELPGLMVVAGEFREEVTIKPPEGWHWLEEDWRLDMSGRDIEAIDEEGWAYGLDFWAVREYPFLPHQAKKKVTDFVRRRRWVRTLAPESLEALKEGPAAAAAAAVEASGRFATEGPGDTGVLGQPVSSPLAGQTAAGGAALVNGEQGATGGSGAQLHARRALGEALALASPEASTSVPEETGERSGSAAAASRAHGRPPMPAVPPAASPAPAASSSPGAAAAAFRRGLKGTTAPSLPSGDAGAQGRDAGHLSFCSPGRSPSSPASPEAEAPAGSSPPQSASPRAAESSGPGGHEELTQAEPPASVASPKGAGAAEAEVATPGSPFAAATAAAAAWDEAEQSADGERVAASGLRGFGSVMSGGLSSAEASTVLPARGDSIEEDVLADAQQQAAPSDLQAQAGRQTSDGAAPAALDQVPAAHATNAANGTHAGQQISVLAMDPTDEASGPTDRGIASNPPPAEGSSRAVAAADESLARRVDVLWGEHGASSVGAEAPGAAAARRSVEESGWEGEQISFEGV
ncbi:hypothetical protein N2152v2_009530 [Parachlorella kessleri]